MVGEVEVCAEQEDEGMDGVCVVGGSRGGAERGDGHESEAGGEAGRSSGESGAEQGVSERVGVDTGNGKSGSNGGGGV